MPRPNLKIVLVEEEPVLATMRTGPTIETALRLPLAVPRGSHDHNVKTSYTRETLKCRLSNTERLAIADQQQDAIRRIKRAEQSLEQIKKEYKAEIGAAQAEFDDCHEQLLAGHEMRQVDCQMIRDFRDNTVRVIRMDTMERVSERTMTLEERQMGLGL